MSTWPVEEVEGSADDEGERERGREGERERGREGECVTAEYSCYE